jgi:AI-2 transport protein TqsA
VGAWRHTLTAGTPTQDPSRASPSLTVLAILGVAVALRVGRAVFVPIALGLFLVAITWPLFMRMEQRMPRWAAVTGTLVIVVLTVAALTTIIVVSVARVAERGPQLGARVQEVAHAVDTWSRSAGLPPFATTVTDYLRPAAARTAAYLRAGVGLAVLALAFFALGISEVRQFEIKLVNLLRRRDGQELVDTLHEIAGSVRRHMVALSLSSAVSGLLTGAFALAVGLELAALWGLLTFLLNYIAVLGPLLAVIPPTLYAGLQFDGLARPALVAAGVGIIQVVMGNFVDPKIEGRVLSLSPLIVLLALVFWGWIWGVPGAFLGIPITGALLIACEHFPQTQWIATLGTEAKRHDS